jgi:hypothetical protein
MIGFSALRGSTSRDQSRSVTAFHCDVFAAS